MAVRHLGCSVSSSCLNHRKFSQSSFQGLSLRPIRCSRLRPASQKEPSLRSHTFTKFTVQRSLKGPRKFPHARLVATFATWTKMILSEPKGPCRRSTSLSMPKVLPKFRNDKSVTFLSYKDVPALQRNSNN